MFVNHLLTNGNIWQPPLHFTDQSDNRWLGELAMKTSKGLLISAALALTVGAWGQTADAHVREVKVYRGADSETVPVVGLKARQRAKVLKGEPGAMPVPASLPAQYGDRWNAFAGNPLWLVDQNEGEVVRCRLRRHVLWDLGTRISCIKGDLPE